MSEKNQLQSERRPVVLIASRRTPILSMRRDRISAIDLGAAAIRAALREVKLTDLSRIDALVTGEVGQTAFTSNSAKHLARRVYLPHSIDCLTVNRQCSSSMDATWKAFDLIAGGHGQLALVVGIEAMANTPYLVPAAARHSAFNRWLRSTSGKSWGKWLQMFGIGKPYGSGVLFGWYGNSGLATMNNALDPEAANMPKTAQIVANLCAIGRQEADRLAHLSQARAAASRDVLSRDIVPFFVPGVGMISEDENVRATSEAELAHLKALPDTGGLVTAGNASSMGGCGVALLLSTPEMAAQLGAEILCEIVDCQASGFDAKAMGLGPVPAIEQLLARNNLSVGEIDYFEINEAFTHVWAAIMKAAGIDENRCNLYGGGASVGHPLGSTGARLVGLIGRQVHDRHLELALAAQCAAGGMGTALLARRWRPAASAP